MDVDLTSVVATTQRIAPIPTADRPAPDVLAEIIATGGPTTVYQPIVHIETGRLLGAEALSRFPGPLSTPQWFALAATLDVGTTLEITAVHNALVIATPATRAYLGWEFVGINVSPHTLLDPRFDDVLAAHDPAQVVIELSDTAEHTNWTHVRRYISRVRELGARIAVNALTCDPTAQLQRLLEIAPEIIKLDTKYTATLVGKERRRHAEDFLRACVQRGVFVVAVGVEHNHDLAVLAALGIDAAQGYLFGRPQPIDHFEPHQPRSDSAPLATTRRV
jgi:EAL domain-containing protein (putative c-di-GMP-specific phosphodiesterase class I)